jgi:hypothetical protein
MVVHCLCLVKEERFQACKLLFIVVIFVQRRRRRRYHWTRRCCGTRKTSEK